MQEFEAKWDKLKSGYKYKVWFESSPVKTIFLPDHSIVIHAVRRQQLDRPYDPHYTVYAYRITGDDLVRVKSWDTSSIVLAKQACISTALWVKTNGGIPA